MAGDIPGRVPITLLLSVLAIGVAFPLSILLALARGQEQAAKSPGLGDWRTQREVILPQAIRAIIPALANMMIVMVKNTTAVLVVGSFDLISSAKAALSDPDWPSPAAETYLFIGAIYFALAFGFARFAGFLERLGYRTGGG